MGAKLCLPYNRQAPAAILTGGQPSCGSDRPICASCVFMLLNQISDHMSPFSIASRIVFVDIAVANVGPS